MCFIYTCSFLTSNGSISVDNVKNSNILLDANGNGYEVCNVYKLPEYKFVKMVRILPNSISNNVPSKVTYVKPTQYVKYNGEIIKANKLVEMRLAEYEKLNIINFYLLSVNPLLNSDNIINNGDKSNINEFILCNGLEVSVYNNKHPLNNRFCKFKSL